MISGKKASAGGSVRGATHIAQDKPCQDALRLYEAPDGSYAVACVADGHGSSHCPYSDEGALAAVDCAFELLSSVLDSTDDVDAMRQTFNAQDGLRIPKLMEYLWKQRVAIIHQEKGREQTEDAFPYQLYGTTLLAVAVTDAFIFAIQIGDGDILLAQPDNEVTRLFAVQEQQGSETFSLCMEQSWQYIQTRVMPMPGQNGSGASLPMMLLLSTDGYANSFTEQAGFLKAGADIFTLWRGQGLEYIKENIDDWLTRSSEIGSGDDITLAVLTVE
jgi:hypothetical protein